MMKLAMLGVAGLALLVAGCTPSQTACSLMNSGKRVFDAEVAAGTINPSHIPYVNAAYSAGRTVCDAPAGTYDQADIIEIATDAYIALRNATRGNTVAYQAMKPQLRQLESLLKQAKE